MMTEVSVCMEPSWAMDSGNFGSDGWGRGAGDGIKMEDAGLKKFRIIELLPSDIRLAETKSDPN